MKLSNTLAAVAAAGFTALAVPASAQTNTAAVSAENTSSAAASQSNTSSAPVWTLDQVRALNVIGYLKNDVAEGTRSRNAAQTEIQGWQDKFMQICDRRGIVCDRSKLPGLDTDGSYTEGPYTVILDAPAP